MAVSALGGVNVFVRSSHGRISKWFLCDDDLGILLLFTFPVIPVPVLSLSHCHGTTVCGHIHQIHSNGSGLSLRGNREQVTGTVQPRGCLFLFVKK